MHVTRDEFLTQTVGLAARIAEEMSSRSGGYHDDEKKCYRNGRRFRYGRRSTRAEVVPDAVKVVDVDKKVEWNGVTVKHFTSAAAATEVVADVVQVVDEIGRAHV